VPDGSDLDDQLTRSDGKSIWEPDDVATVTETAESDLPWLQRFLPPAAAR
jgi:hypothetical protein